MTNPAFSRPGAVDLSNLASQPAGGSYVREVGEADFQELANLSARFPVLVEFYSPRDSAGEAVSTALAAKVNASGGKFLLARVNVDTEAQLAGALGVQAVPTVTVLLGGQLAALFQGTKSAAEIDAVLDQVGQAAVANGLTGRAEPVAGSEVASDDGEPAADPKFAKADAALAAGDFKLALAEFDALLADQPNDAEVIAGRAQAALLVRSQDLDPAKLQQASDDDLATQLALADLEIIQQEIPAAFDRLLKAAGEADAEDREQIRLRLLELFEVVGKTDPEVLKARRRLATLLF